MIFSSPFWIPAVLITLVKIILSGTIGAIITLYVGRSRVSGYASSIRWSRTGGVLEAGILLWNSLPQLPTRSSIAMAVMIFASLFTLVVSILLGALVSRADQSFNKGSIGVYTEQLMSTDPIFWTASMEADAKMNETLISTLNDTRRNPNPVPRTRYTPRTYDYEIACDETMVIFGSSLEDYLAYPKDVNCKSNIIIVSNKTYNWNTKETTFRDLIAPNTIMIAAPVVYVDGDRFFEMPRPFFNGGYKKNTCWQSQGLDFGVTLKIRPKDGLISPPMTEVTKCQFASDESTVISATSFHFAVNQLNDFNKVVTSIFYDDSATFPLLQSMSGAINNGTFSNPTNNRTMVMLIKISTDVDVLVCISTLLNAPSNDTGLLCTYMSTKVIVVKPQEWDPIMAARLNRTSAPSVEPDRKINKLDFTVYHSSKTSEPQDTSAMYSATHLRKATTDAAEYLAFLGHNVFVDVEGRTESEGLYILYDTAELQDAFEVPTVPLVIIAVITLICAVIWGLSEVNYKTVYNGSLYKVIYEQIKLQDKTTSMIMDWTPTPLAFDGHRMFPDQDEQPTLSAENSPEDALDNESTQEIALQHLLIQQPPMPEIPVSSLLISKRLLVPTPTIKSATIITDNNSNSHHAGTTHRSSHVSHPISPPSIPPRPFRNTFNPIPASSTHEHPSPSPPLETNSYAFQIPPPPPLPQRSTPIQNPFW
ncbi:hypothetical protein CPC16_003207 [Podila verticillata]|nr:hypothetical protein CPC16_003207 [Podila verticillata]KAI9233991.1 MAG: hypothetical protein BYD32DRAFT_424525 [Podila humilis]